MQRLHAVVLAAVTVGLGMAGFAQETGEIRIRAYIDGKSELHLRGNTAWWRHLEWSLPGKSDGHDYSTRVGSAEWKPVWRPVNGRDESEPKNVGVVFSPDAGPVTLTRHTSRGKVAIIQQPAASNQHTLIIEFDDGPEMGADWYEIGVQQKGRRQTPPVAMQSAAAVLIKAHIDGRSRLMIRDNQAWWQHWEWSPPGKADGNDFPTRVGDREWKPAWRQVNGRPESEPREVGMVFRPGAGPLTLERRVARGKVAIVQQPEAGNQHTLIIEFDDQDGGAAWYEVAVAQPNAVRPPETIPNRTGQVTIKAYIDGRSNLVIRGGQAWWRHYDFNPPGESDGNQLPTTVGSVSWKPEWKQPPGGGKESVPVHVGVSFTGGNVALVKVKGREVARIVEQPSSANGFALVIEFSDNSNMGADWYEIVVK